MADCDERLDQEFNDCVTFLREQELAQAVHQPCQVGEARKMPLFAREGGDYAFEQTLSMFMAEVCGRIGTKR